MKKVVNSVAYNTDTSALLAKKEFDEPANTVGQYGATLSRERNALQD